MAKESAGLLLYRFREGVLEVFLVHPGGPFWARRDLGAWTIPKGEPLPGEAPLDAARREFREETGFVADAPGHALLAVRQPGGKIVHAWAVAGDCDAAAVASNDFALEWPPRSGVVRRFPEIDRAAWFDLASARAKIGKGQLGLLDQLERLVAAG